MKFFFFVLIVTTLFNSGCLENDNELVKTTFKRSFNKEIISSHLTSNDPEKIKAALLSVSHSEDTSFIPLITLLPFEKYSELICFAIGQIGPCFSSSNYLWKLTGTNDWGQSSRFFFEAIGKTGSEDDLTKITDMYSNFDGPTFPYSGISLAIRQFAFRNTTSDRAKQILVEEVTNPINSVQSKNDALFTLARTESSDQANNELKRILLLPPTNNPDTIKLKQYSLMNFRTQEYFPVEENVLKSILSETNVLLKIEAAKSVCYYNFQSTLDIDLFLNLLVDENPNVSRAVANSIANLKISSEELNDYLKMKIENLLKLDLPQHTLGELFLSYTKLFNLALSGLETEFLVSKSISSEYKYNFLGRFDDDQDALLRLMDEFDTTDNLKNNISILTNLISFQENFSSNEDLCKLLLNSLSSDHYAIVSICADGIDSLFIIEYSEILKSIIIKQIVDRRNNPDFAEGIMSLVNLSEKIDSNFYSEITDMALESTVYSVRKFISDKKGLKVTEEKPSEHLGEILENSFTYKSAEIQTNKGNFVIKLLPQYAPVSVGNFCKLAEKNYFDTIQFHRVVPGFVIQCGDPTSTGWGGPRYEIISETSPLNYEVGMVGMASAGKDTEGSQWFVMQGNYPHLNGRYSVFAIVTKGMDIIYNIDQNDKILRINLHH